jgi:hypothetical protein
MKVRLGLRGYTRRGQQIAERLQQQSAPLCWTCGRRSAREGAAGGRSDVLVDRPEVAERMLSARGRSPTAFSRRAARAEDTYLVSLPLVKTQYTFASLSGLRPWKSPGLQ